MWIKEVETRQARTVGKDSRDGRGKRKRITGEEMIDGSKRRWQEVLRSAGGLKIAEDNFRRVCLEASDVRRKNSKVCD